MNLANMAAVLGPWTGPAPLGAGADISLQLSFALLPPPEPPAAPPTAWSWTSEPRDSARHGAEVAALLVMLWPEESAFAAAFGAARLEGAPLLPLETPAPPPGEWLLQ